MDLSSLIGYLIPVSAIIIVIVFAVKLDTNPSKKQNKPEVEHE